MHWCTCVTLQFYGGGGKILELPQLISLSKAYLLSNEHLENTLEELKSTADQVNAPSRLNFPQTPAVRVRHSALYPAERNTMTKGLDKTAVEDLSFEVDSPLLLL